METFETLFENARREPVTVFEGNQPLTVLYPGRSKMVESASPFTLYARWSRVTFKPDCEIEYTPRPGFAEPNRGRWVIEALNIDGAEVESRKIGGGTWWLPRGIPVLVTVHAEDPEAIYARLRIEKSFEWVEPSNFPGYVFKNENVKDAWVERSQEELKELQRLLGNEER